MIYLDTCYLIKCYLIETGTQEVRSLVTSAGGVGSSEFAKSEFTSAVHRNWRQGNISESQARKIWSDFRNDESLGYWEWFPVTSELINQNCISLENLPSHLFVQAADSLHLSTAKREGFSEIYTNDKNLTAAATYFGINAINVIP